jgi:hypothetical protein
MVLLMLMMPMDQETFTAPRKSNDTYYSPRLIHKVLSKGLPRLAIECLDVRFCLADAAAAKKAAFAPTE